MITIFTFVIVIFAACQGVKWNDFKAGNIQLPITARHAEAAGWMMGEKDDTHAVNWYSQNNDFGFSISFDQNTGECAGVRLVILESDIDSTFRYLYQDDHGIFQKFTFNSEKAFKTSILFSPKGYVTKIGQDVKDEDEVAYFAFLRQDWKSKMISREMCEQVDKSYTNQGCRPNYGLVLSNFGKNTNCKNLKPFYAIYDTNGKGDLIGFGWIIFIKDIKPGSIMKALSSEDAKFLFPQSPPCMMSSSTMAVVEVWLAYSESKKTTCSTPSWVDQNCQKPTQAGATKISDRPVKFKAIWDKILVWLKRLLI